MITAVDTNVLLDIFAGDAPFSDASAEALRKSSRDGTVIACEVVWAEAAAAFDEVSQFPDVMRELSITFSALTEDAALGASAAWRAYRRAGGPRSRILPDFLIGAHALISADRLLTRDRGFYRRYFKRLRVLDPTARS